MVSPPPYLSFPRYPVTAGLAIAAIIITSLWWTGSNVAGFMMDYRVWDRWELWRALTTTLPHVNIFHLLFNLYWLWAFGTFLESRYGHWKFIGIVALLAFTSSLLEFTFAIGGVGLSGIGYGLWGMLWALQRFDPRLAEVVDAQTHRLFIGWFFLCIVLTITEVMPVGNVAHGVGALTGGLLGTAVGSAGKRRSASVAGLVVVLMAGLLGATCFWPWTTFSRYARASVAYAGYEALQSQHNEQAVKLFLAATRMKDQTAGTWFNLGIAYQRLRRYEEALAAYRRAAEMPDATSDMKKVAQAMQRHRGR
jgi:GlpG protein